MGESVNVGTQFAPLAKEVFHMSVQSRHLRQGFDHALVVTVYIVSEQSAPAAESGEDLAIGVVVHPTRVPRSRPPSPDQLGDEALTMTTMAGDVSGCGLDIPLSRHGCTLWGRR